MTEARMFDPNDSPDHHQALHSPRVYSAIKYRPNSEILGAIEEVLNDDGKTVLAAKGLLLSSRIMRFNSQLETSRFTAREMAPRIDRSNSELARIDILPDTLWEPVATPRGEAYRIYLKTIGRQAFILQGLFDKYIQYMNGGDMLAVERQGAHEKRKSRLLSFNLPARLADTDGDDTIMKLDISLQARYATGKLLYADNPHQADDIETR